MASRRSSRTRARAGKSRGKPRPTPDASQGLLARDPKPFRGARTESFSLSSIMPNEASEDESIAEPAPEPVTRRAEQGTSEQGMNRHHQSEGQQEENESENPRSHDSQDRLEVFEFIISTIPTILKAAEDVVDCINTSDGSLKKRLDLQIKRKVLNAYLEPLQNNVDEWASLIDWTPLEEWRFTNQPTSPTVSCLAKVNVALALHACYMLEHDLEATPDLKATHDLRATHTSRIAFLKELDNSFPMRFTPAEPSQPPFQLALDIRTCFLIETLSTLQGSTESALRAMATIFCEVASQREDYPEAFSQGPFRSLAGRHGEDIEALCSERLTDIYRRVRRNETWGVPQLELEFPLGQLLATLRSWLLDEFWKPHEEQTPERPSSALENFLFTYVDNSSSSDDDSESQEIVRLDEMAEAYVIQLTIGIESIKQLESVKDDTRHRQRRIQAQLPTSRDILMAPTPTPPSRRNGSAGAMSAGSRELPFDPIQDDSEAESDSSLSGSEIFQQDDRPLAARKTGKHPPKPSSRRPRNPRSDQEPRRRAPADSPAGRDAHPLPRRVGGGGRTPWSEHDEDLLVRLIGNYGAQWCEIDRHRKKFDTLRRGQLAYRDKARNIKLQLLSSDGLLPRNFDEVRFNKSQIEKLQSMGKNPFREEGDVEHGLPVNTDYP